MSTKFVKAYTRNFSIIMEEAWYYGLSKGLWTKLGLKNPNQRPNFFRFNKGMIEVWEDKDYINKIFTAIWQKRNDINLFDKFLKDYKRLVEELKNNRSSDAVYLDNLFEAISIFSVIWYGILDPRTDNKLKEKFVYVRDRDTIFDSNDKIVRRRILKKYPNFRGFETTLLKKEFLNSAPGILTLKKRLHNFILIPGEYAAIVDLKKFTARYHIKLELDRKPKNYRLNGIVSNPGKVVGSVVIVRMKSDVNKMKKGSVLVSPMTTPDVFPAMRKASAVITDEGGALSHAAILSRELKIPCIIGTKIATQILKDGDLVEVDANKGIVRKLK